MTADRYLETRYTIRGLSLACKLWRPEAQHKVIALHGWLDNAASFDRLASELVDCCVLAPDMAGQGMSDHRPPSATYHLWDDMLDICLLAEQLGWSDFSLLGHSRGAMVSVMLAAACPEKVTRLFLLDGLVPLPVTVEETPAQLRRYLDAYQRQRMPRYAASRQEALRWRAAAGGIGEEQAEQLAARQLCHDDNGWYWRVDERLKAASAVKMTEAHNQALLQAVKCPAHVFLASGGLGAYPAMQSLKQQWPAFDWYELEGHHHVHMTDAAREIAAICASHLS